MFMARVAPGSVLGQNSYLTHSFVARRRTSHLLSSSPSPPLPRSLPLFLSPLQLTVAFILCPLVRSFLFPYLFPFDHLSFPRLGSFW